MPQLLQQHLKKLLNPEHSLHGIGRIIFIDNGRSFWLNMNFRTPRCSDERYKTTNPFYSTDDCGFLVINLLYFNSELAWSLLTQPCMMSWWVQCRNSRSGYISVRTCLHFGATCCYWLREITPMSKASNLCVVENLTYLESELCESGTTIYLLTVIHLKK